jgi:hypothetical protein
MNASGDDSFDQTFETVAIQRVSTCQGCDQRWNNAFVVVHV